MLAGKVKDLVEYRLAKVVDEATMQLDTTLCVPPPTGEKSKPRASLL